MRDLFVLSIVLAAAPISFFSPYFGVLMWSWIAYFNPHRFTWGVAYTFPVAMVIAVPTLVGLVFARRLNWRFLTRESLLLLMLWIWFGATLLYAMHEPLFADHVELGTEKLIFVSKVLLITFVSILVVTTYQRLRGLFLVTSFSFGILALKGAVFGFFTSGEFRVWGPPDSFVADNNAFALATNMMLPVFFFMARQERSRVMRMVLHGFFAAGVVAVILTYSRGGLLGLAVVLAAISIKARRKTLSAFLLVICLFMVLILAPPKWMERMETFLGGQLDESAQQRLVSWGFAWNLVKDYPITGGGFDTFTPSLFLRYAPEPLPGGKDSSGPHSIYFQVLGEHGFVGLMLFLALLACCWGTLRALRRVGGKTEQLGWMVPYSHMFESSLYGFAISGAFLEFAYFDLFMQLVAATAIMKIIARRELLAAQQEVPAGASGEPVPVAVGSLHPQGDVEFTKSF